MKKAALALAVAAAVILGVYLSRPAPELTTLPGPDSVITPVFPDAPAGAPITTTRPAPRPGRLRWRCGTSQRFEDASLRAVLASRLQNDPLFGQRVLGMEAAECSAYRERMAWMGGR